MNIDTSSVQSSKNPLVEMLRPSAANRKAHQSVEADGGNDGGADALQSTAQPATAPNVGTYTPNGTLDAKSNLAQALRAKVQGDGDGDGDGK